MGILADRLNTMTVRVMSPDQTVRLYVTGGGQLHIEFAKGSLQHHTEASLSKQLSISFTRMMRGRKQKTEEILRAVLAETSTPEPDLAPAPPPPARDADDPANARFAAEQAQITGEGRSPRACVTVRRQPEDVMELRLRKGSLQRWNDEEVIAEIQAALVAMEKDYRKNLAALRQEVFATTHRAKEALS